jgi:hypothetical protein
VTRAPGGLVSVLVSAVAAAALLVLAASASGCGPTAPPAPPPPPPVPLHLSPACDLAPSAGLEWLVDARPREIAEIPDLIPAVSTVIPEARFRAFAEGHGGVDLRGMKELCVARYRDAQLVVARGPLDPARVERAFADRVTRAPSRAIDVPNPPVVRLGGEIAGAPERLVLFGREALALETGAPGAPPGIDGRVARIAEAFALGKLHRAAPALRGAALAKAAAVLGDAPLRAFAPGPFEGETARGLGGLLRAATAVAASARFAGPPARIALRLVLTGAWQKDGPAAERLAAAAHVIAESALGHLLGVNEPLATPVVRATEDALVLDAVVDGNALARGLHDALDAEVSDILGR